MSAERIARGEARRLVGHAPEPEEISSSEGHIGLTARRAASRTRISGSVSRRYARWWSRSQLRAADGKQSAAHTSCFPVAVEQPAICARVAERSSARRSDSNVEDLAAGGRIALGARTSKPPDIRDRVTPL